MGLGASKGAMVDKGVTFSFINLVIISTIAGIVTTLKGVCHDHDKEINTSDMLVTNDSSAKLCFVHSLPFNAVKATKSMLQRDTMMPLFSGDHFRKKKTVLHKEYFQVSEG